MFKCEAYSCCCLLIARAVFALSLTKDDTDFSYSTAVIDKNSGGRCLEFSTLKFCPMGTIFQRIQVPT